MNRKIRNLNIVLTESDKLFTDSFNSFKINIKQILCNGSLLIYLPLFIFIGWNGVQILLYFNTILSLYQFNSLNNFLYNLIYNRSALIPMYVFFLISLLTLFSFFSVLAEVLFNNKFFLSKLTLKECIVLTVNFFVPFSVFVLSLTLLTGFLTVFFIQILNLANNLGFPIQIRYNQVFSYLLTVIFLLSFITLVVFKDNILQKMMFYKTFSESLREFAYELKKYLGYYLYYYFLKSLFISITLIIFWFVLNLLLIPLFKEITDKYVIALMLHNNRKIFFEEVLANIFSFSFISLSCLIIFVPIISPFYLFLKVLHKKISVYVGKLR